MSIKHGVYDDEFTVDSIPAYPRGIAAGRESAIEKAYLAVKPGETKCIRQYGSKESAAGQATALRKRHKDDVAAGVVIKVGPISDVTDAEGELAGLFVSKPVVADGTAF